jgi:hypothetical protein
LEGIIINNNIDRQKINNNIQQYKQL